MVSLRIEDRHWQQPPNLQGFFATNSTTLHAEQRWKKSPRRVLGMIRMGWPQFGQGIPWTWGAGASWSSVTTEETKPRITHRNLVL